jgi:gluconolactonase
MKSKASVSAVLCLLGSVTAFGQGQGQQAPQPPAQGQQAPRPPATDTVAPNIPGVVAGGTKVEVIMAGFEAVEGAIALPDGSLIFCQSNVSRITKIDKNNHFSTFLENTNGSNGLTFDSKGRLISAQTTPGQTRVGVVYPKGSEAVLADNFEGKPFGRPNDLMVDKKGGVYFSDRGPGLPPAVYYIPPGGKALKIDDSIKGVNGIQLSPDEKTLYVNDTRGEYLVAFDVQPDGTVRNRRNFAKYAVVDPAPADVVTTAPNGLQGGADGLAMDNQGRLYVARIFKPAGVQVFSPQGQHLGTIPISGSAQNLAFAGPDKKTLYIVGGGAVYKVQMLAQGITGRAK